MLRKCYLGEQLKNDERGVTCGVWGNGYKILVGESSVILNWILKKLYSKGRLDLSDLPYRQLGGGGTFGHGCGESNFINCG